MSVSPKFGNPAGWYGAPGKLLHLTFVQKHDNKDTLSPVMALPTGGSVSYDQGFDGKVNGRLTWQFDDGLPQASEVTFYYRCMYDDSRKEKIYVDIKARWKNDHFPLTRTTFINSTSEHPYSFGGRTFEEVNGDLTRLVRRWVEGHRPTKLTPADFRFVYNRPTPWAVRVAKYDGDAAIARDDWATACFNALFKEYPIQRSEFEPWEYRSTEEAERDVGVGGGPGRICSARASAELGVEWAERDWATLMSTEEQLRARKRQRLVELDKEREALAAEVEQETKKAGGHR